MEVNTTLPKGWELQNGVLKGPNGQEYSIQYTNTRGASKRGTTEDVDKLIQFYLANNRKPSPQEAVYVVGFGDAAGGDWRNTLEDLDDFINTYNLQKGLNNNEEGSPKEDAFSAYYNDLYSTKKGTRGRELYDNLAEGFSNQAEQNQILANVSFQQQAMNQAKAIKSISDQIRAERMARLKSGMSESQIANQDMQTMMANVNTLNQNAQMLNQQRLQAQSEANLARDNAYQAYLQQANAQGQVATGMYAADVGSADYMARRIMQQTGQDYGTSLRQGQGLYDDEE